MSRAARSQPTDKFNWSWILLLFAILSLVPVLIKVAQDLSWTNLELLSTQKQFAMYCTVPVTLALLAFWRFWRGRRPVSKWEPMRIQDVRDAAETIGTGLGDNDEEVQAAAYDAVYEIFSMLHGLFPTHLAEVFSRATKLDLKSINPREQQLSRMLIERLDSEVVFRFQPLLRLLLPDWINGGEGNTGIAPPFSEVRDHLISALDCGVTDYEGYCAVFIGRYGPEAEEALPELLDRLQASRTDYSKAPGLTWAVYMIGGLRPAVKALMIQIAEKDDSCPHSRKLAQKILEMNQVAFNVEQVDA